MTQASKTFRIFISSTFEDLKAERNALQSKVFPRLRSLCEEKDYRFQAIDLRWGVREEAGLDQRTMKICLDELERCQSTTLRPNFIVLLGNRYGWRPLPEEIPASEFEKILDLTTDKDKLARWYERDDNAEPALYRLQARTGTDCEDGDEWRRVEGELHAMLLYAATKLELEEKERIKYEASATEQEILKGALSIPDAPEHVFCFFRELEGLPRNETALPYIDITEDGQPDTEARRRLKDLKDRLSARLPGNIHKYEARWTGEGITTDHLGKLCDDVFTRLSTVILSQMEGFEEDALTREIEEHRLFGEERAWLFYGRDAVLRSIDEYLQSKDPHPFAIFGEGGSGKSALLACAAGQAEKAHPQAQVIYRFIGATPPSSDCSELLESICRQVTRSYGGDESTIPESYEDLVRELPARMARATEKRPLILFIDSLDQLAESHNASSLNWLPSTLPSNVRVLLSTRPGAELVALQKKLPEKNVVELGPMSEKEGSTILGLWLEDAARKLTEDQGEETLRRFLEANGNPLYLRLAFEESRLWRSADEHHDLNPGITGIIRDLYRRLSSDVNHGGVLVPKSLGYLAASRDGLSEDELIDILSLDQDVYRDFTERSRHKPPERKLPVSIWSRFYYDLRPYLSERTSEGTTLLTFYHKELGQVAEEDYLSAEDDAGMHLFLADYFEGKPPGARKVRELPWQLSRAKSWKRLNDTLADLEFFNAAWEQNQYDAKSYWASVEANSKYRMAEAYKQVIKKPDESPLDYVWPIARLLQATGHPEDSLKLYSYLSDSFRKADDLDSLQASLGNQAVILYGRGDLDGAMELYKEKERICRELGNVDSLQISLGNQALILYDRGDLDGAMELHKEQERICRELGIKDGLQASLGNQANILKARGDLDGAMELHKEEERICRELGNKDGLQASLGNQALILYVRGDLDGAMELYKEQERICRELGNVDSLQASLGGQANILYVRGDLDGAMALYKESERICRELGNVDGLQRSLGNQAVILAARGDLDGAMELMKEQERICRELGNPAGLQASLGNQALILKDRGDLDGAMELHKEEERICRELGNVDSLQISLGNQANILKARGDLDGAMELHKESERICRELGNKDGLQASLGGQALILKARGDLDGAMKLLKEKERICRELGNVDGLAISLAHQSLLAMALGKQKEALALADEAGQIALTLSGTTIAEKVMGVVNQVRERANRD